MHMQKVQKYHELAQITIELFNIELFISVFKIFIWGGILSDIRSEI